MHRGSPHQRRVGAGWAVLALSLLSCLSACAFTNVPLELPKTVSTGLSGGDGRRVVVVSPFADARPAKDVCGIQKNQYEAETAKALCTADPSRWIAEVLSGALQAAGFAVQSDGAAAPGALVINGTLDKLFVEPLIGFTAITLETDMQVRLTVTSGTGLLAERTFFVKGIATGQVARAGNFQRSVDTAADQMVKDMVAAIITLANRYPQLGGGGTPADAWVVRAAAGGR